MILRHRDKELLRFDWVGDARVRIDSVNGDERRFLPLEFGEARLDGEDDALRYPLEDWLLSRSAPLGRLEKLDRFRFKKHRHYNWSDERRAVMSGFLQKRAEDIRRFGRKADEKAEQSLVAASVISSENVGVKLSSESGLSISEQRAAMLILRNSAVTEEEISNQLDVTIRQAERIIAALKKKAGLRRRGSDKVGEWYFDVETPRQSL